MDLEYALITSSSLPDQVQESDYYTTLSKAQFLDLVDYSEVLVGEDPKQKVLLLMVAKGTPEQEAEDAERKKREEAEQEALAKSQQQALSKAEAQKARLAQEEQSRIKAQAEEDGRKKALRERSKAIINGLYSR
jgi:hypothetical protein